MKEIKAIIRPDRLSVVMRALHAMPDLPGVTISTVRGTGRRYPSDDVENAFDEHLYFSKESASGGRGFGGGGCGCN